MKRIGILTSGGDCQGLNAAIRGVAKSLYEYYGEKNLNIYGIRDGYRGLIYGDYHLMKRDNFSGILTVGGTILGTSRQPFKLIKNNDIGNIDRIECMINNYKKMKLDCLVIMGGNGTHKTANLLSQEGLNIVTLPKTIDNDLWGTDITFGFQSAVNVATNVLDCIHTTASSHSRVFIIELMGHKAGWLTLHAGLAGGADIILIPEIPYDVKSIIDTMNERSLKYKKFSIIVIAEGAMSKEYFKLSKKEQKEKRKQSHFPSVSYELANEISNLSKQEIKVTVPGHVQRGGSPCPFDRVLSTRFGAAAADLIINEKYGYMVAWVNNSIKSVLLNEVAGKLKLVPKDSIDVKTARNVGVSFGD